MKHQLITFVILLFSINNLSSQALNGTYTIGSADKDFQTFTDAISSLVDKGVDGDVQFLVDPGSYNEQIKIDSIIGTSADARVSFLSSTRIKEDVILQHEHTGWSTQVNYTVYMNGADYVEFSDLTIEALPENPESEDYNRVIYVTGNSDHITFRNNIIRSFYTNEHYFEYNDCIVVGGDYLDSKNNNFFTFENNHVIGGATGISLSGSNSAGDFGTSGWIIKNNHFIDQSTNGIVAWIAKDLYIENNIITSGLKSHGFYKGIEVNQATGEVIVNGNAITAHNNGSGIFISHTDNSFTDGIKLVSNNSIIINSTYESNNSYGIYSSLNNNLNIAHNCIYHVGDNNKNILYYSKSNDDAIDNTVFVNNHLLQDAKSVCFKTDNSQITSPFKDFNNYYAPNGSMALIGLDTLKSFTDIQNNGYDLNSSNINPNFSRPDFLVATNNLVYNTGTSSIVEKDKFGNTRSNMNPDIGIYEGVITPYDVGISSFSSQNELICDLADNLKLTIKNYADEELNSVTLKAKNQEGTVVTYPWNGTLLKGEESSPIIIDNLDLSSDQTVIAWTESPNLKTDLFSINDTMDFQYKKGMSGDYSVGNESADFQSLNMAIINLSNIGICGPVSLNILPGIYDEKVYIPFIEGTSEVNTITIQSMEQNKSSVSFESTNYDLNYIFKLEGTRHIHVKHLTFKVTSSTSDANSITLSGTTSDCIFSNLAFSSQYSSGNSSTTLDRSSFLAYQTDIKNILIEKCNFGRAPYQLTIRGGNSFSTSDNIIIRDNVFEERSSVSIYIEDVENATISNNVFIGERSGYALSIVDCFGSIKVERNKINIVEGNGIKLDGGMSTSEFPLTIVNNFITTPGSSIIVEGCANTKIIHNNLNITQAGVGLSLNVYSNFEELKFTNNIINIQNGNNLYNFNWSFDVNTNFIADNNVLFSHIKNEMMIYVKSELIPLSQWRTDYQHDLNSIITNPKYISNQDLHLYNTVALDGKGMPGTEVFTDIDGELRNTLMPDIGADEIDIDISLIKDLSIEMVSQPSHSSCDLSNSIEVLIKNNAISAVDSFYIMYTLFGKESVPLKVVKRIEPGEIITQKVIDYRFTPNTLYKLEIDISKPDNQVDDYYSNNSQLHDYYRVLNIPINKHEDDCDDTVDLSILSHFDSGILWSTGSTNQRLIDVAPGDYNVTLTTLDGCQITNAITVE